MIEVIQESLLDSVKILPFLYGAYLLVAWMEQHIGAGMHDRIRRAGAAGPLVGALFGSVPQCGFSVMGSALYARRLVTAGTLLAVFISTSDEALPIIAAQWEHAGLLLPILLTKIALALIVGYAVDLSLRSAPALPAADPAPEAEVLNEHGCCDHHIAGECTVRRWPPLLWHPLVHTAKIFVFIFLVTLGLGLLHFLLGEEALARLLLRDSPLQPVITALVGLIPNCAASVAIAQVYLQGAISFGAVIAGLCTSAGVGILVLFRENPDRRNTFTILGLLLAVSIGIGILLHLLDPWLPRELVR